MRSGLMRHIISIQEPTETKDSIGGLSVTWANVSGLSSVPAAIWSLRGNERIEALKTEYQEIRRIRIRYRSGITTKMRVYWEAKSKTFNIISKSNPDEKNIMLDLLCSEET
jgi:SPP1 family predicted phage head-tail adaptor